MLTKSKPVAVTFQYDTAERLTQVDEPAGVLKTCEYDPVGGTGKMKSAARKNRTDLGEIEVKETFHWDGRGGRLSKKTTTVSTGESFTDSYTYDDMGQLETIGYPSCNGCPSRNVSPTYSHGLVTDVGGWTYGSVTSTSWPITYHPNGMVNTIRHANSGTTETAGPLYTQTLDDLMSRPGSISISNFCNNLSIAVTPASQTVPSGTQATLTATAPGATSIQWFEGSTAVGTGTSLTVTATATKTYWARASNGTCFIDSEKATVTAAAQCNVSFTAPSTVARGETFTVTHAANAAASWSVHDHATLVSSTSTSTTFKADCTGLDVVLTRVDGTSCTFTKVIPTTASTASVSGNSTIVAGGNANISAAFTGAGPWTVTWSDGASATYQQSSVTRTVTPAVTTTYEITQFTDANACAGTISGSAVVTVRPPAPTNLSAAYNSVTGKIDVTWSYTGPAVDRFDLYRNNQKIHEGSTTSHPDAAVSGMTAYWYEVRAVKSGQVSDASNRDEAAVISFAPIVPGQTKVAASHVTELRTLVNSLRLAAGLAPAGFSQTVAPGVEIARTHITTLRTALDEVRQVLLLPPISYERPTLSQFDPIRSRDITDLRGGVD